MKKKNYRLNYQKMKFLTKIKEKNKKEVDEILNKNSVYYEIIGKTQKDNLDLDKEFKIKLTDLSELSSFWFKDYFKEDYES